MPVDYDSWRERESPMTVDLCMDTCNNNTMINGNDNDMKVIDERNQLQLELSELQSERDKLFEEKVSLEVLVPPPPNKGHSGANSFVPCREVVPISEVNNTLKY